MTTKILSEYLSYDATTGNLIWIKAPGKRKDVVGQTAGSLQKNGYRLIQLKGNKYQAHKIVWWLHHSLYPDELDHRNNNRDDNRLENLRLTSRTMNNANRQIGSSNTTGFKGVRKGWNGRFTASIQKHGTASHLGTFNTPQEAAQAYDDAAIAFFGVFAKTNKELGLL